MNRLYIIGNGFDLAHGLKTSYWNFRELLFREYPNFLESFESFYGYSSLYSLDHHLSKEAISSWENNLRETLWSNLEYQIGYPDFDSIIDFSESLVNDLNLESGPVGIKNTMDEYWTSMYKFIDEFNTYVGIWANTINTDGIKPRKQSLVGSEDAFLSFNYTDLLENVYEVDDVLHIHGSVDTINYDKPFMGHCNKEGIKEQLELANEAEELFDEGEASIRQTLVHCLKETYKDTDRYIWFNKHFWKKLRNVTEVMIIGWSAGVADLPYLSKIRDSISKDAKWIVYYFDEKAKQAITEAMESESIDTVAKCTFLPTKEFWD